MSGAGAEADPIGSESAPEPWASGAAQKSGATLINILFKSPLCSPVLERIFFV